MADSTQSDNIQTSQTLPSIEITSPDDLKDSLHHLLWQNLPRYLQQAGSQHGISFEDCRIEYYRDYRILMITPEGLGVDMDHRQNDVNYFQAEAMDIAYSEAEVEYIDRRKAEQYDSYATISLFQAIWTDVVKQLSGLKSRSGVCPTQNH